MNQPIRILNLFMIMNRGGAETLVMNYYRKIDRSKVQFDFMVHRQERGAYEDEIEALGGRIYRMSPISLTTLSTYRKELRDFFKTHTEYKVLHAHMSEMAYFIFNEAEKHNIPVRICHAHNAPVFFSETMVEKIKRIPREILARLIRKNATDFFTCSQIAGEWLFGKTISKKMLFMRNAVDATSFVYDKTKADEVRTKMGWNGKTVIGHVGRFNPQKNHTFLIDIFELYQRKNKNAILVLIGAGFLENSIKQKVQDKGLVQSVEFLGSRNDIPYLLQGIDLFLFPSLYEGLPVSLIEAQSAGIPCVVSDTISEQAKLTEDYFPVSLKSPLSVWKDTIESALQIGKKDTYQEVKEHGFDVVENASWLCDYYLTKSNTDYKKK